MEHKGLDILMEHKDIYLYLMEHKDTKTQRIKQSIHSAKATHKKNFVSSCLCVQLKKASLCSVKKSSCLRVFVFS